MCSFLFSTSSEVAKKWCAHQDLNPNQGRRRAPFYPVRLQAQIVMQMHFAINFTAFATKLYYT